jgi:hypothetical protein
MLETKFPDLSRALSRRQVGAEEGVQAVRPSRGEGVAESVDLDKARTGDASASAWPCSMGSKWSSVPWMTSVGMRMSARRSTRGGVRSSAAGGLKIGRAGHGPFHESTPVRLSNGADGADQHSPSPHGHVEHVRRCGGRCLLDGGHMVHHRLTRSGQAGFGRA